jgi:lysophospholipase L1-like esterase
VKVLDDNRRLNPQFENNKKGTIMALGHLVICLGASIVRGLFGTNFVEVLRERLSKEGFRFVNYGVGGDMAYNVLTRLHSVIARQPDYIVILVGTNDVTATLYPRIAKMAVTRLGRRHHQRPSAEWYQGKMLEIIKLLKERTQARIAVASLPILGEDLASLHNERVRAYNALLKEISVQEQVAYLPVNERQEEYLREAQHTAGRPFEPREMLTLKLLLRHYLFRQSFDEISKRNKFLLVTDGMHMNSQGAAIIADQIETFLRTSA